MLFVRLSGLRIDCCESLCAEATFERLAKFHLKVFVQCVPFVVFCVEEEAQKAQTTNDATYD